MDFYHQFANRTLMAFYHVYRKSESGMTTLVY